MKIKNIFLADDDSDDVFLFREALKEIAVNVNIHIAENGDALLKMLANRPVEPDLILLDLNMPIKNGFQSLEEIRANDSYNNIPIAILSTTNDEKAIAVALQSGANAYITKPVAFADLKKIITKCLTRDWNSFEEIELHTFVLKP